MTGIDCQEAWQFLSRTYTSKTSPKYISRGLGNFYLLLGVLFCLFFEKELKWGVQEGENLEGHGKR